MSAQAILIFMVAYLGAVVISVPLAKRLGLGSVLGYLIAGFAIGPSMFGLISHPDDIMHVSEFGIIMMLFLAGLELQPDRLWAMRKAAFELGTSQVALTALLVAGVSYLAGLPPGPAVAIGFSFAMSSTAIVLQGFAERGKLNTTSGETAFAMLLFQDVAVVPILAVLPLLAPALGTDAHESASLIARLPGWVQPLGIVAGVALIFFAGRFLCRPLFRVIARTRLREVFTAAALLVVSVAALIMASVGLSPALGAFLGGVVLADSEFRHELESDIEPFKGLLLGLFFISVGANIDLDALLGAPLLVAALVVGVVAAKIGIVFALMRLFGYQKRDSLIGAVALSQIGEFAFLLISVSKQAALFSPALASLLTLAVTLSMLTTPVLFMLLERFLLATDVGREARDGDVIEERRKVIIAGFGRVGQIIGRLLLARGISVTVLEHDDEQLESLRRFDFKAYYGDARREAVMRAAGADQASLLIVATDVPATTLEIVEMAKRDFPKLRIVARAFDRVHAYALEEAGADAVVRETFGGALELGTHALRNLGFPAFEAERIVRLFRRHDLAGYKALREKRGDDESYRVAFRAHRAELKRVLSRDVERPEISGDSGWDVDSLIEDVRKALGGR